MSEPETPANSRKTSGRSIADRILRASALVFLAHVALKFISLIQFRLIGRFCDPVTRDLFIFGFEGVLLTVFLVGEEALGPAFLPVFMEEKEKRSEEEAWAFANAVLVCQGVVILVVMLLLALFPMAVVAFLTKWDRPDANAFYMANAPVYARYMVLGLLGMGLGSTTYMLLNGYKRFFLAAFGDAAVKIGVVGALLVACFTETQMFGWSAAVVFVSGTVVGSGLKLFTHLFGLRDKIRLIRLHCRWGNPAFRRFLLLMAPLIVGILFAKVRDLFNQIWIPSHVEAGLLSANAWGRKLYQTIGYLIPYAVSIAMLPFFCELVDRDEKEKLGTLLTRSGRMIFLMCAPIAAIVIALSLPLAQLLYQTGRFSYHDCEQVAVANACYSLVLPFYALEYVLMQAFFSNRKMISVTILGIIFSTLSMGIAYVGVVEMKSTGMQALAIIALAFTVSRILKVGALSLVARRFLPCFPPWETCLFVGRTLIAAFGAGLTAWEVRVFYESEVMVSHAMRAREILLWIGLDLALSGIAGGTVGLTLMWLLCREDLLSVKTWTLRKFRR